MIKMQTLMLRTLCTTVIYILLSTTAAADSLPEMIDEAGLQRMLTQRIVKAYAQLVINVDADEAREQLKKSVSLFGKQLQELEQSAPNESVRAALAKVRRLWDPFSSVATGPVNREGMMLLSNSNDELLAAAHEVVISLQDTAGTSQARLVNIAGRQRMLSQRITKLYVLASAGLQSAELREQMQRARHEFEGALADLRAAPENTPEIQRSLAEVERQWTIFRVSFQLKEGEYIPMLVTKAAENILTQMNQITRMYGRL